MKSVFVRLASTCALGLLFLSQFVPTSYVEAKATLLFFGLFFVYAGILKNQLFFSLWQIRAIAFLVLCGLLYSAYGFLRGNPGAIRVLSLWLVWPLVYLTFSTLLKQENSYRWLKKIFTASLVSVVFYSYLYLGNASGLIPDQLYFELEQGQNVGFYEGFVEYNLYSISSLIFLLPFYLHYLLERYKQNGRISLAALLLALSSLLLALLSGRRALLLALLVLPLIILLSNKFLGNEKKLRLRTSGILILSLCSGSVFFIATTFDLKYDAIVEMFLIGFDFTSSDISASLRAVQFSALLDGWLDSSFLIGAGNGAVAAISRSDEFPWAYELTYIYLLFSTGLLGTLIYFGWYGYGLIRLREASQERPDLIMYTAPILTASVGFCLAASTNPYFGKFDYLWIVLLPLLIAGWAKHQKPELPK
jgi:hypothetical protein